MTFSYSYLFLGGGEKLEERNICLLRKETRPLSSIPWNSTETPLPKIASRLKKKGFREVRAPLYSSYIHTGRQGEKNLDVLKFHIYNIILAKKERKITLLPSFCISNL